ncbi:MAG: 5-formyltetrahydrofolate cyclo-ligase [Clostridia bacterium]|nr:5-formyltetrahydrofolate cyclo-ligase [Clostridia bacterium]
MYTKKELRAICRTKRENIVNKGEKSRKIAEKILSLPQVKNAETLFVFYPLAEEVNLLSVAEYGWLEGKRVAFPLCEDKDGRMSFRLVSSLSELADGHFGTKEPSFEAPEILPENAVIFLPALAVDKKGYRLGYGKGYYDRYLAKYAEFKPFTVGVIYRELLFDEIPHDEYDIPCDTVVCDGGR